LWVTSAYLLSPTVSAPLYGKISNLYGRKVVFQAAILIFLAGFAVSWLLDEIPLRETVHAGPPSSGTHLQPSGPNA
jgi:MFS family permease